MCTFKISLFMEWHPWMLTDKGGRRRAREREWGTRMGRRWMRRGMAERTQIQNTPHVVKSTCSGVTRTRHIASTHTHTLPATRPPHSALPRHAVIIYTSTIHRWLLVHCSSQVNRRYALHCRLCCPLYGPTRTTHAFPSGTNDWTNNNNVETWVALHTAGCT